MTRPHFDKLNPNQQEVVELLCQGRSLKQIAHDLNESLDSVQQHARRARASLECTSSRQMVVMILQAELDEVREQCAELEAANLTFGSEADAS